LPAETAKFGESRVPSLEDRTLLLLIIAVSLALGWILWPFFSAILWATVLAIVFTPLYQRLLSSIGQHPTLAALTTVLIIVILVILPLSLTATAVVQEATNLYERIQSGELDLGEFFQQLRDALPVWVTDLLDRFGLTNLGAVQERISDTLKRGSQFLAAQALTIGQGAADFVLGLVVMLYLLFFLLRDGAVLFRHIVQSLSRQNRSVTCSRGSRLSFVQRSKAAFWWLRCKEHWAGSSSGLSDCTLRCSGAW
jgi:predicted PurR-regulated permease PerM